MSKQGVMCPWREMDRDMGGRLREIVYLAKVSHVNIYHVTWLHGYLENKYDTLAKYENRSCYCFAARWDQLRQLESSYPAIRQ